MVEGLKVRHPEFAKRLREAAKSQNVEVKDIARQLKAQKVSYEMARRYWGGYAKPRGARLVALAGLVGLSPADLEYGSGGSRVAEPAPRYVAGISPAALDVARAWGKLSPSMQRLYRESIFRDAATESVMPWLKSLVRPNTSSYDQFEKAVEHDYHQHLRQLKLEL